MALGRQANRFMTRYNIMNNLSRTLEQKTTDHLSITPPTRALSTSQSPEMVAINCTTRVKFKVLKLMAQKYHLLNYVTAKFPNILHTMGGDWEGGPSLPPPLAQLAPRRSASGDRSGRGQPGGVFPWCGRWRGDQLSARRETQATPQHQWTLDPEK